MENIVGVRDNESLQTGSYKVIFFRKLLESIVGVWDDKFFRQVLKGCEIFSEIFGNYWKLLLGCETTNLFRQVLKEWILLEIYWKILLSGCEKTNLFWQFLIRWFFFGNFRKLLEYTVGLRDNKFFRQGLKSLIFFRTFSEIIGKYCWSARQWISSKRFL